MKYHNRSVYSILSNGKKSPSAPTYPAGGWSDAVLNPAVNIQSMK